MTFRKKHEGVSRCPHLNPSVSRLLFDNDTLKRQRLPPRAEPSSVCSTATDSRGPHPKKKEKKKENILSKQKTSRM